MFDHVDHQEVEEVLIEVLDELHFSQGAAALSRAQPGGDTISSIVQVIGSRSGAVVVTTTSDSARPLGAMLLGTPPDELTDEDIADAVGELTNLLAGGMKSLIDEETSLGTPTSAESYLGSQAVATCSIEHVLVTITVSLFNEALSAAA